MASSGADPSPLRLPGRLPLGSALLHQLVGPALQRDEASEQKLLARCHGEEAAQVERRRPEVAVAPEQSSLELGGTSRVTLGDEMIYHYHGYVAYNFGHEDARARPYALGGLGATQFGSVNASVGGQQRNISGLSKFSTTWALGVKVYPNARVGVRIEGRWTPTYIKSDATGWWCDPFWGCYVVGNAQYTNQFELSGGLTLRF